MASVFDISFRNSFRAAIGCVRELVCFSCSLMCRILFFDLVNIGSVIELFNLYFLLDACVGTRFLFSLLERWRSAQYTARAKSVKLLTCRKKNVRKISPVLITHLCRSFVHFHCSLTMTSTERLNSNKNNEYSNNNTHAHTHLPSGNSIGRTMFDWHLTPVHCLYLSLSLDLTGFSHLAAFTSPP